jgi:hypothetical protein
MKVILNGAEIGQAIIDFLSARGIDVKMDQIYLEANRDGTEWRFKATVSGVEIPPKEGPYR